MAARTTSITPIIKTQNPLHLRPVTPAEYAKMYAAAQSKAAWLLKDHTAALEAQMAADRADLEAEVERRTAEMAELNARRRTLSDRRAKAVRAIRKSLEELPELGLLQNTISGSAVELAEVQEASMVLRTELAAAVKEAERLRRLVTRAEDRVQRRGAEVGQVTPDLELGVQRLAAAYVEASTLGKGMGRRAEAPDEVDALRRRKAAETAGHVKAAVSA